MPEEYRKLFVGNLDSEVKVADLQEIFSYFGNIRLIRLIEDRGIGFVEMFNVSDARQARLGLNGIELKGRQIRVEPAQRRRLKEKAA